MLQIWKNKSQFKNCQLENKINSLEISDELKNLIIGLMINKEEEEDTIECSEFEEEENQILVTQETSSEESSQNKSDNEKECDGICVCSYKSINLILK